MNSSKLAQMIMYGSEDSFLDFKEEDYLFHGEKKIALIKDIISMANTPRNNSSYIVIGVKDVLGGANILKGVSRFTDDMQYQNIFGKTVVNIPPCIAIHHEIINEKKIIIIEIKIDNNVDIPYVALQNFSDKLEKEKIYYRLGSTNREATASEKNNIYKWFHSREIETISPTQYDYNWQNLKKRLETYGNKHDVILIISPSILKADISLDGFGSLPFWAIIDGCSTNEHGNIYKSIYTQLGSQRTIHKAQFPDRPEFHKDSCVWFFLKGLSESHNANEISYKEWASNLKKQYENFIDFLSRSNSPRPLTAIFLSRSLEFERYEEDMLSALYTHAADRIFTCIISEQSEAMPSSIVTDLEACLLPVGLSLAGSAFKNEFGCDITHMIDSKLPGTSGTPVSLDIDKARWISEYLSPYYLDSPISVDCSPELFRRGGAPSFEDIALQYDCKRTLTSQLKTEIEKALEKRRTVRLNLFHAPGAGGTTLSKRIAYDLHEVYPCVELKKCSPNNTFSCLKYISDETKKSILIVAESALVSQEDLDNIYYKLRGEQLPSVLLQITRRPKPPSGQNNRWLADLLDTKEEPRLRDVYLQAKPSKRAQILAIHANTENWQCINFGLAAYEENYLGLSGYVSTRLANLSIEQKKIIIFFAIAYYYAQQSLPSQLFSDDVAGQRANYVQLDDLFKDESSLALELLRYDSAKAEWRVMHQLVASEILQQLLRDSEENQSWTRNLAPWGKALVETLSCANGGDRECDLIYRIFLCRNNFKEIDSSQKFSQFFEDIEAKNDKIALMEALCENFPHHAHIFAHAARMYSHFKSFQEAKNCVKKAIDLDENDNVIWHIYGTVLQEEIAYAMKSDIQPPDIFEKTELALEKYSKSIELSTEDEHGYISSIRLCLSVINSLKIKKKMDLLSLVALPSFGQDITRLMAVANDMILRLTWVRKGGESSERMLKCQAELDAVYDDFSAAIQCYNNLLQRNDIYRPTIRYLLAETYLQRERKEHRELDKNLARKIFYLLEENVREERDFSRNMSIWIQVVRKLDQPPSFAKGLQIMRQWKQRSKSNASYFYSYVFSVLNLLNGNADIKDVAMEIEECKTAARYNSMRTFSREWLGSGNGVSSLVSSEAIGEWNDQIMFFENYNMLRVVEGRIEKIIDNGKGYVRLACGLEVFFIPSRFNVVQGRDERELIRFYLAFSYDGLIAWQLPKL